MNDTIQLRNHHLNQGRNKDKSPIFPITKAENILGLNEYLNNSDVKELVKVPSLPATSTPGTIYYNTTEDKYYIADANGGFKPMGGATEVVDDIEDVAFNTPAIDGSLPVGYILEPNVFYDVSGNWLKSYPGRNNDIQTLTMNNATIKFNGDTDTGIYAGRFTVTTDTPSITWPAGVYMSDEDNENFSFEANHRYEFNVFRNVLCIKDITHTETTNTSNEEET